MQNKNTKKKDKSVNRRCAQESVKGRLVDPGLWVLVGGLSAVGIGSERILYYLPISFSFVQST